MTWKELKALAVKAIPKKNRDKYIARIKYEIKQIEMQGASDYWVNLYDNRKRFDKNPNGLVIPWLLGITEVDPIENDIPHNITYRLDFPDIDIDFLPISRDYVKRYASETYGQDHVCSVGSWQTYKPKSALIDTSRAMGMDPTDVMKMTKALPQEFDDMSFEEAYEAIGCEPFKEWVEQEPIDDYIPSNAEIAKRAYKLVKLIKAQGRHAGGLIISKVPVKDHIPLTRKSNQWVSAWTEGRSTQLSKFGFVKFDILGLTNLSYIWMCKRFIKQEHGIDIDFEDMDPEDDRAGWQILPDGSKHKISFNDGPTLSMMDDLHVDTIFQFDTDLAKSILAKGGVKSFNDLVVYTSLGRPGPLPLCDEYIARRDGKEWKEDEDPRIVKMLDKSYGIVIWQEQLSRLFVDICGFTIPEAEAARKAVAKKWADELAKVKDKMIAGATRIIGMDKALEWWEKIESFARYCFNLSHALAYVIISYRSAWLKCHYPAEWWASVMAYCSIDKLIIYMGIARADGIKFGPIKFRRLHKSFTVNDGEISPGLASIKGIGDKAADKVAGERADCESLDELIEQTKKNKIVYERLIKLGAFDEVHWNRKALWQWYLYKYSSDRDTKKKINQKFAWPEPKIQEERNRMAKEYFKQYPRRKKIPNKIAKWKPKINITLKQLEDLYDDYTYEEKLGFEKEYLGYYNSSPMKLFEVEGFTIAKAKKEGILECIIEEARMRRTSTGNEFMKLELTDGIENAVAMVWSDTIHINDCSILNRDMGVRLYVQWNDNYRSFTVRNGSIIMPLKRLDDADID